MEPLQMTKELPEWVKPGQLVYRRVRYAENFTGPFKIAKVHKTGRFVLEESTQQYSSYVDGSGARATGDGYCNDSIFPDSPGVQQLLASLRIRSKNIHKIRKFRNLLDSAMQVSKYAPDHDLSRLGAAVDRANTELVQRRAMQLLAEEAVNEAGPQ
jgi:hypothetical protein